MRLLERSVERSLDAFARGDLSFFDLDLGLVVAAFCLIRRGLGSRPVGDVVSFAFL